MRTPSFLSIGCGVGLAMMLGVYPAELLAGQEGTERAGVHQNDPRDQQSRSAECRKKLEALREDIVRETCKVIDEHIQYLEARLETVCRDAGERIHRTVDNVEGIYIQIPIKDPEKAFRFFHGDDRYYQTYVSPTLGKHFTFWEMDSFRKPGVIDHRELEIIIHDKRRPEFKETSAELIQPKSEYGIRWNPLTSVAEERQGLYGDELTVFNVKNNQVLATRKLFYYVVQNHTVTASGRSIVVPGHGYNRGYAFTTCKNYNPGSDDSYTDQMLHHSYKFVSKVLRPKPMPQEVAIHVFDLARGSGNRRVDSISSSCSTLGPGIKPEDIELSRLAPVSLRVRIKGTSDTLTCEGYFHPATFNPEMQSLRFYDGSKMKGDEILKRAGPLAPDSEINKAEVQEPDRPKEQVEVAQASRGLDRCSFVGLDLPEIYSIYAAGGHAGRVLDYQIDQSGHQATQIDVTVNSVSKPAVLLLGAYDPTIWNIRWTSETNILAVIASGYHRQAVAGIPKGTPILISTYDNKSSCGYFLVSGHSSGGPNALSRRLFRREVDHVFYVRDAVVVVGDPIAKDTKLVTSPHTPPESYIDATAPMAGLPGLEDAVKQGLMRKATEADVDAWVNALMGTSRNQEVPSIAANGQPTRLRPSVFRGYVVLKEFVYPAGLYGGNSGTFFIPKGVPSPIGDPGHSTVYDFNTLRCHGPMCRQ